MGCKSTESNKPQRENSKKYYDLSDKEMKDFARLRSYTIDPLFVKNVNQYLHFMNKYQKKYLFRHKNDFSFRLIDQGPLKGLYIGDVTAVVYSKSGDYIQDKGIIGSYHLMLDHESYYSNNDYKRRLRYTWIVRVSDFVSQDCENYFVKIEYDKIKDQCDQSNFPDVSESEYFIQNVVPHLCLSRHNQNYDKEEKKYCETLVKNINSSYEAFAHSYYMSKKNSSDYEVWIIGESYQESIQDNMLHNSIFQ